MKKTHHQQRVPLYFKQLWLISAAYLFLAAATGPLYAQPIEGKVFFNDSRQETLSLDQRFFERSNGLKVAKTGKVIPLEDIVKVEINERIFVPKKMVLYDIEQGREQGGLTFPKTDTSLLVQRLIAGTLKLYHHMDFGGEQHLFIEKDTVIKELVQIEYMEDGKAGTLDWYKGVLKLLMSDCQKIPPEKIENLKFISVNIEKLVIRYNKNCGSLDYARPREQLTFKFGPQVGVSYFKSSFEGPVVEGFSNKFSSYFEKYSEIGQFEDTPVLPGGFVEVNILRKLQKTAFTSFNFHFQVSSPVKLDYDYEETRPFRTDTIFVTGNFEANYYEAGVTLQKGININHPVISPFIGAGLGLRNLFNLKNHETYIISNRPFWHEVTERESIPEEYIPQFTLFGQIMAGIDLKRFQLAAVLMIPEAGISTHKKEKHFDLGMNLKYRLN